MTQPINDPRNIDRMAQIIADTAEAHGVDMPEDAALALARMALAEAMAIASETLESEAEQSVASPVKIVLRIAATLLDGKLRP